CLPVREQVLVALVGLLRGREPGELAHRPQPAAITGRVDATRVRILTRHLLGAHREVVGRVERLDRNPRDGRGLDVVGALGPAGLELLAPELLRVAGPDFTMAEPITRADPHGLKS